MLEADQKLAIHELLNRAAYGLDVGDLAILADCFAPDATMRLCITDQDPIAPFEGHAAIMALMQGAIDERTDVRRHVVSNIFFESEGKDSAKVISNLTLFAIKDGVLSTLTTGIYQDEVIRTERGWQLQLRHLDLDLPY